MSQERLIYLFDRYYRKEATRVETDELLQLIVDLPDKELAALVEHHYQQYDEAKVLFPDSRREALYAAIWEGASISAKPESNVRPFRSWLSYAAAVLIVLVLGIYFYRDDNKRSAADNLAQTDIQPGRNRATLRLADGRTIDLSMNQSGIVVGGEVTYSDGTAVLGEQVNEKTSSQLQVLVTPKGGTYQITLPDSSKVWLNADSKLTYPVRFSDSVRMVELEGEAYFAVARLANQRSGKVPFVVRMADHEVKVEGTEFNIKAYRDERKSKVSLVNGKVAVSAIKGAASGQSNAVVLRPGQQATVSEDAIRVREVDIAHETAWKNGLFSFKNKAFTEVMAELGRWYDVAIEYDGPIPADGFFGIAHRAEKLSLVLNLLESAGVTYRLECKKDQKGCKLIIINSKGKGDPAIE